MRQPTISMEKAGRILDSFSTHQPCLTATQLAKKTGLPLSTTHRILSSLVAIGLLAKDDSSSLYSIGRRAFSLGELYLHRGTLDEAAEPAMRLLNELTGEAVNLGVLEGGFLVIIKKLETEHAFRFATRAGSMFPAYTSSMGKALLADLQRDEVEQALKSTERFVTGHRAPTLNDLLDELETVCRNGFALDTELTCDGVSCVGASIRNSQNRCIAAISVAAPTLRMKPEVRTALCHIVPLAAHHISSLMGFSAPQFSPPTLEELRQAWDSFPDMSPSCASPKNDRRSCAILPTTQGGS